jgi:hypothetical protein
MPCSGDDIVRELPMIHDAMCIVFDNTRGLPRNNGRQRA